MKRISEVSAIILAASASGCATHTVRLDRARTMVSAGHDATGATRALITATQMENRALLLDLTASDQHCALPTPVIAQGRTSAGETLCRSADRRADDFDLLRLTRRDVEPSLAVIDALAAYLDAADAIVTREPFDFVGPVAEAQTALEGVATIAKVDPSKIPGLAADQRAAIGSTLKLISEILDEARRVRDLRRLELGRDDTTFAASIQGLNDANHKWINWLETQLDSRRTVAERRLQRVPNSRYDERRAIAAELMAFIERQEGMPELRTALDNTVAALDKAHGDYLELLFGDGRSMTDEERRKAAAVTRARVLGALGSLSAVIKAF